MSQTYDLSHVRHVALYLRKSRGDLEHDLDKHRDELVTMCTVNNWSYVEYAEIGTGDSIKARPKMQELLRDVALEMFDGVCAVDYDRLGRGDKEDQAKIEKTLQGSETVFIAPPNQVLDLNSEYGWMLAEFKGLVARQEYKMIAKRLRAGKARGAKLGFWTNGTPPFPYRYNAETRKAEPDEDSLPTYRWMVDRVLDGYSTTDIAWDLNRRGIPSATGKQWQPAVVRRLLTSEVHLGNIVVGKKRVHPVSGALVYQKRDDWITYQNCHEAVKTQREHDAVLFLLTRERSVPPASKAGKSQFAGLVRCAKCNSTMQMQKRKERPGDDLKSCVHRDLVGKRCGNMGGRLILVEDAVIEAIRRKEAELVKAIESGVRVANLDVLLKMQEAKQAEIKKVEKRLTTIREMREDGEYTKEEYLERASLAKAELERYTEDLKLVVKEIERAKDTTNEDHLAKVREVLRNITSKKPDPKEVNRAFKSVIQEIIWEREDFDIEPKIKVRFL